jgi:reactive chlorine resistance protein C
MALATEARSATRTVPSTAISLTIQAVGLCLLRYGLVLVLAWIGAMKFTAYEANGIQPLVANSPFMGWVYHFLSTQAFSNVLGVVELAIATLIALRPLSPAMAAVGSGAAVVMFLTTLSQLSLFYPRLGAKPRRISSPRCRARTVPAQGRRPPWRRALVVGRSAATHRACA